ncbi:MAG: lactonase family protein [Prolixibacteraceae bacterium]
MIKYLLISFLFLWSCGPSNGNAINDQQKQEVQNQDSLSNDEMEQEEETGTDTDSTTTAFDEELYLYIGTYTDAGSKGIYLANFDVDSGLISTPKLVATVNNASFQCISTDETQLWSVNESGSGNGEVVGFRIDSNNGTLSEIGKYSTKGSGPCYVSYDEIGNTVLAANYNSGNVIRIETGANNKGNSSVHQHEGSGPNVSRQSSTHAHSIKIDLKGKYAYSCDLGADKIYVYKLEETGLKVFKTIQTQSGSGPRHLDFHPEGKAMMVLNELNSSVETYLPDQDGCFSKFQKATKTIPSTFTANNQCADIHFSSDGKLLFASNRGHNSIVSFKVNQTNMELTLLGYMQENIDWPRNFALSPDGNFILVANQNSNLLTVYRVNQNTGLLSFTGNQISLSKPVCVNLMLKTK